MPRPLEYQSAAQPIADTKTGRCNPSWYMWFMNIIDTLTKAGDVFGPGTTTVDSEIALWNGTTGILLKRATGTGVVHATSGVYSTSRVTLAEIIAATGGSRLIGRRSTGSGDWEEVTLGSGLSMSSAGVLSATIAVDYVVSSDGANPPTPVNDGAGNFVYVAYTP